MIEIKRILCPVDFSECSRHALDHAVAMARWKASRAILRLAAERHSDLIVMGVQGRGGVDVMVFGSNTHDVIRSASCPVLTVHGHQLPGGRFLRSRVEHAV